MTQVLPCVHWCSRKLGCVGWAGAASCSELHGQAYEWGVPSLGPHVVAGQASAGACLVPAYTVISRTSSRAGEELGRSLSDSSMIRK